MILVMKNILIIDDSWLSRSTLKKQLTKGFNIFEADHCLKAFPILENHNIDIILLDLLLPDMDGLQFLQIIREKEISVPVIVISADIQSTTKKRAFALGAREFLNKPAEGPKLLETINSILNF